LTLSKRLVFSFAHDLVASALAFAVAMYLRIGDSIFAHSHQNWLVQMVIFTCTCLCVFSLTGVYKGVWRYASVRDLAIILRAVTIAVLLFLPISFALTRLEGMPRSIPAIVWFVLLAFMGGSRLFVRLLKEGRLQSLVGSGTEPRTRVLLVGAGNETEHFIRATLHDENSPYQVVGVLDEKGTRVGREIHSVAVLGQMHELSRVIKELKARNQSPSRLILSKAASRVADFETFLSEAEKLGLALSHLPSMTDLREGMQASTLRPIALEDLLGRPETLLDRQAIVELVKGKRVLVTGAGGTIGSELSLQIAALNPQELILIDNGEFNLYSIENSVREKQPATTLKTHIADVRDAARINAIFAADKPQLIFHAAALKHVPIAEANIRETVLTNVMGTRNVADAAAQNGADAVVLISTDKAVRPTSVMGATKRVAEHYCQSLDHERAFKTRFLTVRFGNVLGSTGSVVPRFQEQLAKGGPLTVTHPDITRYFMTVREAVELVLQASAHATQAESTDGLRGRIMVLDMGKPIKIAELARQIIRLAGLKPDEDIKIKFTGLRPGEKLFEELFSDSEKLSPSGADGVLLAASPAKPLEEVKNNISSLVNNAVLADCPDATLRAAICVLVPEFVNGKDAGAHNDNVKTAHG